MRVLKLKRVYEEADPADGRRILVERLWPRGLTRERAAIALWLKELAPSPELRKWFDHDMSKWEEFRRCYRAELEGNRPALDMLRQELAQGPITFVYAARDEQQNSAQLLKEFLEDGGN